MTNRSFEEIKVDVGQAFATSDAEALLRFATELDALDTPQAAASASQSRGWALYLHGDYTAALSHYQRALALHEELGNRSGVARVTGNIGSVHQGTGDYPEALSNYHRALSLHEELGNRSGVATVTVNIGIVHNSTGDYPEALSHYHRALAILEELGERSGVANITNNIGNVHASTYDYPEALSNYHRALAIHEELGNRSGVALVTGNIGNVHGSTGDYPEALSHYYRALSLHEELGERSGVAGVTGNIVGTYLNMGSDVEAQALLQTMDDMQIDEPGARISREQHRATLHERRGDLGGATATLQRALAEASEHGRRAQVADTHMALRDLAHKRNDFAAYIEHNNEYTRITEEINGKDTATKLAMQVKQREIEAERKETDKQLAVLHSTLPKHIADRVARGEVVNDTFDNAAVLFLDVVGFTTNSSQLDAGQVVELLQNIFTTFDSICAEHDVMKIKTIGDSYMAVAFEITNTKEQITIPEVRMSAVAHAMMSSPFTWPHSDEHVMFRIGLNNGPVVAGVLGTQRMQYDVWGDTVNVASRMESSGEAGRIHVSEAFANALRSIPSDCSPRIHPGDTGITVTPRGTIDVKGKGTMRTYWLESTTS